MSRNKKLTLGCLGGSLVLIVLLCCCCLSLLFVPLNSRGNNRFETLRTCVANYPQFVPDCVTYPYKYLIEDYDGCVAAGYPVLESYPAQCVTPDGKTYTQPITMYDTNPPAPTPVPIPVPTPAPSGTTMDVKVYYSSDPESYDDPNYSVAVDRSSKRTDIATYTIEELIAGPTEAEAALGLFTPIDLSGTSNCEGKDFTLKIDASMKKAILQFCRNVLSAGIGDDARVISTVNGTLTQFTTVESVVILTKDGNCFGDESGMNVCLK